MTDDLLHNPDRTGEGTRDSGRIRAAARPVTVSHILGEISWLVSQSARHAQFRVSDLGWLVMPAIPLRQFHIFRDGDRPVGVALWAFPPATAEEMLGSGPLSPASRFPGDAWRGGERLWLVDLVAPFATDENHQLPLMIGDLMAGPFRGREFRMLAFDRQGGGQRVSVVAADAGQRLADQVAGALRQGAVR